MSMATQFLGSTNSKYLQVNTEFLFWSGSSCVNLQSESEIPPFEGDGEGVCDTCWVTAMLMKMRGNRSGCTELFTISLMVTNREYLRKECKNRGTWRMSLLQHILPTISKYIKCFWGVSSLRPYGSGAVATAHVRQFVALPAADCQGWQCLAQYRVSVD